MLKLSDVKVRYGNIRALKGINIEVPKGQIVTMLGPNGAGKSTTLNAISGVLALSGGSIEFDGERIDGLSPDKIVKRGISQVSEGREIFPFMTVKENLELGAYVLKDKRQVYEDMEKMFEYFPVLKARRSQNAGTLSGGEQQMLLIARSLMSRAKLILMDELSLGLAPILVDELSEIVMQINKEGTTILLVEQNAKMALNVSKYAYVLENGSVRLSGDSNALRENEEVKNAYLGGK